MAVRIVARLVRSSVGLICLSVVISAGCAAGGQPADAGPGSLDASRDAGAPDSGPAARDAGTDAGADGGSDGGSGDGMGGACAACESDSDCLPSHYCAELMSGGSACLPSCNPDLPDCPPRFDCVANFTSAISEPVCAPVGERCCVDADGDLHGTGVGCLGVDCDDEDMATNESATEVCDGSDNDCDDAVDEDESGTLCPRTEHVAESRCAAGACEIGGCEPGWADCNMRLHGERVVRVRRQLRLLRARPVSKRRHLRPVAPTLLRTRLLSERSRSRGG